MPTVYNEIQPFMVFKIGKLKTYIPVHFFVGYISGKPERALE